jgi:hypothetical protein
MPTEASLTCAVCLVPAALSVDAEWNYAVYCPTCGRIASFSDAFREAKACETAYLRGARSEGDDPIGNEGASLPRRFVTTRMLCVLGESRVSAARRSGLT